MFGNRRKKDPSTGLSQVRRVIVLVVGGTVVLIGLALLLLPGPGVLIVEEQ